jgi:hypothetical protein
MTNSQSQQGRTDPPDEVGDLIAGAGLRRCPNAAKSESVRIAVHDQWLAAARRRRAFYPVGYGLAASLAFVAMGLGWLTLRQVSESPPRLVGTIVGMRGPIHVTSGTGPSLIVAGIVLAAGARLETGPSGAVLLSVGPVGVRMGPTTVVEFERPGGIRLVRGQIYVDSGETTRLNALVVATPFGTLSHQGTQYQLEVQPGRFLFASVREGRILLADYGRAQSISRGEGLQIVGMNETTRLAIPPYDARWQWVSNLIPEFSIEGQSLSLFLDWFARETGRTLVFVTPTLRSDTDGTTLNGKITGLTPVQALNAVLATTRFQCDLSVPSELRISIRTNKTVGMNTNYAPYAAIDASLN